MTIILSISATPEERWAAGPNGLFRIEDDKLTPTPQPMERLACCCAIHDRLLVGGAPHGAAYLLDGLEEWQAAWMDGAAPMVLCLAADPEVETSGVLLAGSESEGVFRTTNRGRRWVPCNFGLHNYTILTLAWAPPMDRDNWLRREIVFAGTEEGIYRSPNGGRGWKRAECPDAPYQSIAVGPDFHSTGVVLAGSEDQGLWRSNDGGRSFAAVEGAPQRVNALAATPGGWLLSDENQIWRSADGLTWTPIPDTPPALVLVTDGADVLAGTEEGVAVLQTDGTLQRRLTAEAALVGGD